MDEDTPKFSVTNNLYPITEHTRLELSKVTPQQIGRDGRVISEGKVISILLLFDTGEEGIMLKM
jgi:hypothetical protein